jgi:hypothetical protein
MESAMHPVIESPVLDRPKSPVKGADKGENDAIDSARARVPSGSQDIFVVEPLRDDTPNDAGRTDEWRETEWRVPEAIAAADAKFDELYPKLLKQAGDCWVYVHQSGDWQAFAGQDDAEIAARNKGLDANTYVIRFVPEFEQSVA